MQITIDTPYVTVGEYAKRSGQSDSAIRREIELGRYLIRPKTEGSKSAVLINMVHIAMEAAEQAERVRQAKTDVSQKMPSNGTLMPATRCR
ncbi:hypothetical protein SAMN05660489_02068 [Pseudomonas sp. LAMO17WK12:I10]|uniref:hypothetical protein n=1 Tax=unclassified Pseudomonas TaxID=196821 RepID=UPI000BC7E294|nr:MULTISPECIES: hypothetical protein [unclassified Pseudomonas]PXX73317.1 hypothetical protein H160_02257 [Pseudomonas sp. LAMO17WK12:I9]SNY25995.1 hypothetical protein SAMN05660489_02068 [Pseudomonas sp. LAMO17WK12:I10]